MRLFAAFALSALLPLAVAAQGAKTASPEFQKALLEFEAVFREDPENVADQAKRLDQLKLLAATDAERTELKDAVDAFARRERDLVATKDAIRETAAALADLDSGAKVEAVAKRWAKAVKEVRTAEWTGHRQGEWHDSALLLLKDLRQRGTDARTDAAKPDWITAGKSLRLAMDISHSIPPEVFHAQDSVALQREAEESIEKMYFDTDFAAALPWEDMLAEQVDWKRDDDVKVAKKDGEWTLENTGTQPCLFWLNRQVEWQDYTVRIEVTVGNEAGFQFLQRQSGESPAAAAQDVTALLQNHAVSAGERTTLQFSVYGGKYRTSVGEKQGRPCRCAPTGSRAGGFSFRFPPGAKIVIHKLEVKVLRADE